MLQQFFCVNNPLFHIFMLMNQQFNKKAVHLINHIAKYNFVSTTLFTSAPDYNIIYDGDLFHFLCHIQVCHDASECLIYL